MSALFALEEARQRQPSRRARTSRCDNASGHRGTIHELIIIVLVLLFGGLGGVLIGAPEVLI
jgi:hypothetical protein